MRDRLRGHWLYTNITEPGHYFLTRHVSCPIGNEYCTLTIGVDRVELDLNGFSLTVFAGIEVLGGDDDETLHSWDDSSFVIRDCTIVATGEAATRVSGCSNGYADPSEFNMVDSNVVTSNGHFGMYCAPSASRNVYRGNAGTVCTGAAWGGNFCDEETDSTSGGGNFMPDAM